jgi:hypothetical protein
MLKLEEIVQKAEIVSAEWIIRLIFFSDTVNSVRNKGQILILLFENVCNYEKEYEFFQQKSATAHTTNKSTTNLYNIFGDQIINK